jgi:hypothetical protein
MYGHEAYHCCSEYLPTVLHMTSLDEKYELVEQLRFDF